MDPENVGRIVVQNRDGVAVVDTGDTGEQAIELADGEQIVLSVNRESGEIVESERGSIPSEGDEDASSDAGEGDVSGGEDAGAGVA